MNQETTSLPASYELFAAPHLAELDAVAELRNRQNAAIRQAAIDEAASPDFQASTVLPVAAENRQYTAESDLDRVAFLRERLYGRVLDIGAGPTDELEGMAAPGATVTYLDTQPFPGHEVGDARQMTYPDSSFDSVYSRNCVQTDPKAIITEALRVLNHEQGTLVLASALASGSEMRETFLASLAALEENGISLAGQCEITLAHHTLRNVDHPEVALTQPEILITVSKGQKAAHNLAS